MERSGVFGLNLTGFARGNLLIVIELHRVIGAALAKGPQLVDITKHIGERDHRTDDDRVAAHVLALNLPAPREQVTHDSTRIVFGRRDFDLHDWLEQDGTALLQRFTEGRAGGDLEGEHRRVDVMIGAIDERCFHIDNREARENARAHDAVDALFNARDEFLWHRAADNLTLEARSLARLVRLEDDFDSCEL